MKILQIVKNKKNMLLLMVGGILLLVILAVEFSAIESPKREKKQSPHISVQAIDYKYGDTVQVQVKASHVDRIDWSVFEGQTGSILTGFDGTHEIPLNSGPNIILFKGLNQHDTHTKKVSVYQKTKKERDKSVRLKEEIEEMKQENKEKGGIKKKDLKNKYEKIVNTYDHKYEVKNKLSDLGFQQVDSGVSKAPDGSNQMESTYKQFDNGCAVYIKLQSSYGRGFFHDISVECV